MGAKTILLFIIFIIFRLVFQAEDLKTEPAFYWNIGGGMSLNIHSANFTNLGNIPCCNPEEFGVNTQISWQANAGLFFPLTKNWLIGFDLGIVDLSSELVSNEASIGKTQVRNSAGEVEIRSVETKYNITPDLLTFSFNPGVKYKFENGFMSGMLIGVGTRIGYFLSPTFEQYEKIISPDNVTFLDERLVRNDISEDIPDVNNISIAPNISISYDLLKIGGLDISPKISYFYNLTNINSNDWRVDNLNIGVSIGGIFHKSIEKNILRDTVYVRDTVRIQDYSVKNEGKDEKINLISSEIYKKTEIINSNTQAQHFTISEKYEKRIRKISNLIAKVETYGINENGEIIDVPLLVIEEFETIEGFPLLPFIYYEKDNFSLESSHQNFLSVAGSVDFTEEKLKSNIDTVSLNLLNIIAKRMTNTPVMDLKITAYYNEGLGITSNIAKKRTEKIEEYLKTIWNIYPDRISSNLKEIEIEKSSKDFADLLEEARRIEFSSPNIKMNEPVFISDITRTSNPPLIGINLTAGGATEAKYIAKAVQDERELRTYSGGSGTEKIKWDITKEPIPFREKEINVSILVSDEFGNIASDSTKIKIEQLTIKKKREISRGDKIIEKYTLVVFDYNSSEITPVQKNIINMIKSKIKPKSIVKIQGYADRTGTEIYNKNLARDRCNNVLNNLKTKENTGASFSIDPIGSSKFIYDNDTPLGRSLSRCVRITIETPVDN
jgi:outer membrane protein OmpA-like peptidoglycan-associated protein